ncbi:MAG: hypothetical protein AB7U85_06180 [Alphaproteobacteria bacterium]
MLKSLSKKCLLLIAVLTLVATSLNAKEQLKPLTKSEVPEVLREWIPFTLFGVDEKEFKNPCPYLYDNFNRRVCLFPDKIKIDVKNEGFSFEQNWRAYDEGFLTIAGGYGLWPQNVKLNNKTVPVVTKDDEPAVYVSEAGVYQITGEVKWDKMPETIKIPVATAAVDLTVEGKKTEIPEIDDNGKIRLKRKQKIEVKTSDSATLKISRHIVDEVPTKVETLLSLEVSGQDREIVLAKPELDGFKTVDIKFPLPIKIENNGNYKVYAKAGRWYCSITSVAKSPFTELAFLDTPSEGLSAQEEIWTFEARPDLRSVTIKGVKSIDPSLTEIPRNKRKYPAYLVSFGDKMIFDEEKRGFDENTPDELRLRRKWVMMLDGQGYFIKDDISGSINKSTRLEMANGELGRVDINDVSQLITKIDDAAAPGVEVRQGAINLRADSRVLGDIANLDVNGWKSDFKRIDASLTLPPGWSLFEAFGADEAYPTWVGKWTLLDVFIVLVTSAALYKLLGASYGFLSVITLVLTHHELPAASWLILFAVIALALEKFLPECFLSKLTKYSRRLLYLSLLITIAVFSIDHIRQAVYPAIEDFSYGRRIYQGYYDGEEMLFNDTYGGALQAPALQKAEGSPRRVRKGKLAGIAADSMNLMEESVAVTSDVMQEKESLNVKSYNLQNMLKDTNVQTGVGVSEWRGKEIFLKWNSMVEAGHKVKLIFISARLNMVLSFVRVILLWLLAGVLIASKEHLKKVKDFASEYVFKNSTRIATMLIVASLVMASSQAKSAEATPFPSKEMLQELKTRVMPQIPEKPDCYPDCFNIEKTHIFANGNVLSIKNRVHVASDEDIIFPLPTVAGKTRPNAVIINGNSLAPSFYMNNAGFVVLGKGINDVEVISDIPQVDAVQINFPLKASVVTSEAKGWTIRGIEEDKTVSGVVQLVKEQTKEEKAENKEEEKYNTPQIKPYLIVERNIDLGLTWTVVTRVIIANSNTVGAVVKIPLLNGESVTTKGIEVTDGQAVIDVTTNMPPVVWNSVLEEKSLVELFVSPNEFFTEVWKINASNIWNVKAEGLPRISSDKESGLMVFKPWAGEALRLNVVKPQAVDGQVKTFDKIELSVKPSERNLSMVLDMVLRSSLGTQHKIKIPDSAKSPTVLINGERQFANFENGEIVFPVVPGSRNVRVEWLQPENITNMFKMPKVDVGASAVNVKISADIPEKRWILLAGGAAINPAILFWSILPLIILLAVGLGFYPSSIPLKKRHWFLLFLGLSQTSMMAIGTIVVWFLLLEIRKNNTMEGKSRFFFNLRQLFFVVLTFFVANALISGIANGLLGSPDMKIAGYASSSHILGWYQDFINGSIPDVWFISVPIYVWRGLMLLWALWLAFAVTSWAEWAFACFSSGGVWRKKKEDAVEELKTPPRKQ